MSLWPGGVSLPLLAGTISTAVYMSSTVPMVVKALKTRNLQSYSFSNLALCNAGNAVYWVYVAHLPFGPIWFLHGFMSLCNALMFCWYLKYARPTAPVDQRARTTANASLGRPARMRAIRRPASARTVWASRFRIHRRLAVPPS